ncbi:protein kinase domain-containing protein [Candidatus Ferrigenium straubiae]|jgi:serine/threonine protein kinase|uniref:protein kinase domain-containing protein n=1 Tax=Candidatus Ferrigenium straubiae TaxID=2919506 RepID=UPI003F4A8A55
MSKELIGRFETLSELGRGGQGTVYLAYDPQLDRKVAIKTLRKLGHKTEQLIHEARIVSKLQHPNIITLYDSGEDQGAPYLVYAYVEGKTLAQVLKQEKAQPFARAAEIACGVLEGLAYAHGQGISHLDMKPANIMIAKSGTPMVMDFGLATTTGDHQQTIASPLSGTPRYVAPEIISGQRGDSLSDIYSLGTVLYEMVTGEFAVGGENMFEVLNRAAHEQIAPPSVHNEQMDEKLEAIILKAVAKKPAERYPSATAMKQDLQDYLSETRNAATEFLLHRMRSKQDFPALSGIISEINQVVASETESTSRLAGVILQDLALTNKLLKVVNAASYGQFGGTINTISKAVVILGFETVRNIATSLILLEFMQNKPQAAQLKDEIVKATFSGVIAAQLSARHDICDIEEAMVCSMFHNLGRMLGIYYFFEESQEISRLMKQGESEDEASARILGISYPELGLGVVRSWNFPPRLIAGMRKLSGEKVRPAQGELDRLAMTVNLAHELCEISTSSSAQDKQQSLADLAARYGDAIEISEGELSAAIHTGLNELSNRSATLGISTANSPILSRIRQWNGRTLSAGKAKNKAKPDGMSGLDLMATPKDGEDAAGLLDPSAILSAGIQDVSNTMMGDYQLNDILQMVLETMHRGMGFNRTLIMIRNNKLGAMLARFGFGAGINELIPKFRFPLQFVPDVFHLSVEKGLDISIEDIYALNISDKIPGWYRDAAYAPCFVLLPLMLNGKAIGLFYGDMLNPNSLHMSQQQLSLLRTLRNQAVLAIKQKT